MPKRFVLGLVFLALAGCTRNPQAVLQEAAATTGATNLKSIQYSGSGSNFALGQSFSPDAPWPRFNVKTYTRAIDYDARSSREELLRTQAEEPPRGGGQQPLVGEQQQRFMVSGEHAWNMPGDTPTPAPAAAEERQLQIWLTPHGFLKAAMANNASGVAHVDGGRNVTVFSFTALGKFKVNGVVNDQNLVEKVETWVPNPVLGDMLVETHYSDYKDFNGVKFPTHIHQVSGGHPTLELTVSDVQPNVSAALEVPEPVRQATVPPVRVESQRLAEGVWFLGGGSHHSVAVEFRDFMVMVEGPQNEERSLAVIAEAKKLIPNKPIRYVVNTHHHFDHSGGLRTYVAEGATIVTHQMNRPFYERSFQAASTLVPDSLSKAPKQAVFETLTDKHVLTDGTRTLEIHLIRGNLHNEAILMAYLPTERILIEADVFTPPAPDAPPPAAFPLSAANLYENIQRLGLNVARIAPIHGRVVPVADLRRFIAPRG
jgi:glyoxylase-like metal-dependent hydrolase (beta-lactamase superfamily II)